MTDIDPIILPFKSKPHSFIIGLQQRLYSTVNATPFRGHAPGLVTYAGMDASRTEADRERWDGSVAFEASRVPWNSFPITGEDRKIVLDSTGKPMFAEADFAELLKGIA